MSVCAKGLLSPVNEALLLDVLFEQGYALEIVSCELSDIESGQKEVSEERYKKLLILFDELNK